MTNCPTLQMWSNLSLLHMIRLLHMTNNCAMWCKIAFMWINFDPHEKQNLSCWGKLLHMTNLAPRTMSAASATNFMYAQVMHCRWCTPGDTLGVMHWGWCIGDDALAVIHRWWITTGDASGVMHQGWCTTGDAPQVMPRRWCIVGDAKIVVIVKV